MFLDNFATQVRIADLNDGLALDVLSTCLEDRAARWFHEEKLRHGAFTTYGDLAAALKRRFTLSSSERKCHEMKLRSARQSPQESVLDFNHRFEGLAAQCNMLADDLRDAYVDALRPKLRDALDTRCPADLEAAMRDAMSLDVAQARRAAMSGAHPEINQISGSTRPRNRPENRPYQPRAPCKICRGPHPTDKCKDKCTKCGRLNHTADHCSFQGCDFCYRANHTRQQCFRDPNGPSYRPPRKGFGGKNQ